MPLLEQRAESKAFWEMFQKLLRSMNEHAYSFEQQVKTAGEAAPERNMSLFERKAGSGK